jgi:subtilase family serine protease
MKSTLFQYVKNTRGATAAGTAALLLSLWSVHAARAAPLQSLLTHHTRPDVTQGKAAFVQHLDATSSLHIVISLPVRQGADLQGFVDNLYNPASPNYKQYLSVREFADTFGPTQADYDSVKTWARENNFTITHTAGNRHIIQVDARVADIERAFHVAMNVYQHPTENRTFYAPDREPMADAPVALWHVGGLDNYSIPRPMCSRQTDGTPRPDATGSGPGGQFLGSDFRAAYYGDDKLTGAGQSLGLLEYVGFDPADPTSYFSQYGPPLTTTITPISTDGTPAVCPTCEDAEQALDIEHGISMAPALDDCRVYVGSTDDAILNSMADENLCKTLSCSWEWRPADPLVDDPIFLEYAAQGQTFLVASGDSGAWGPGTQFSWPADDGNVVSVGGTDLITDGGGGAWVSETAWSDSGGGVSLNDTPIPVYQKHGKVISAEKGCSRTLRNAPDVAAESNFDNWICYDGTCGGGWGGTSFATPRWAGYLALANQQAAKFGRPPVGFVNPSIYKIGQLSDRQYLANFHDITVGGNGGFLTFPRFDLVTGWGSPNGPTLITHLVEAPPPDAVDLR